MAKPSPNSIPSTTGCLRDDANCGKHSTHASCGPLVYLLTRARCGAGWRTPKYFSVIGNILWVLWESGLPVPQQRTEHDTATTTNAAKGANYFTISLTRTTRISAHSQLVIPTGTYGGNNGFCPCPMCHATRAFPRSKSQIPSANPLHYVIATKQGFSGSCSVTSEWSQKPNQAFRLTLQYTSSVGCITLDT